MINLAKLVALLLAFQSVSAWSPTNGYAPGYVKCPSDEPTLIRKADGLSSQEKSWLTARHAVTQNKVADFLKYTAKLNESDYSRLLANHTLNIGITFSGGGYRAMLSGAGQLSALDNTTEGAFEHGLGGLLQSSTYLVGLSGGSWLVGTLAMNNWTSVQDIVNNKEGSIWDLRNPLYALGGADLIKDSLYWSRWIKDIQKKQKAGFDVSFIDVWTRALSSVFYQKSSDYGAGATWSTISQIDPFTSGNMPFPIAVSDAQFDDDDVQYNSATVFETNPFEFGSWDPTGNQFAQVKYLGSNLTNGVPYDSKLCVQGFDNGGFVMGTSSNVFSIPIENFKEDVEKLKILYELIKEEVKAIDEDTINKAIYPNPFYGSAYGTSDNIANDKELYMLDGSSDGENIPLIPIMLNKRQNDIVFAFDNSADTKDHWPNAQAMVDTYERQFSSQGKGVYSFPYVPPASTFIAKNFTQRPVFFGCDASNLTALEFTPPLVVYIANSKKSYASNTETLKLAYTTKERNSMIKNGFEVASRSNYTEDSEWATCVGCAIIRRSQEKAGIQQTDACKKCFQQYCWDGTV